MAKFTLDTEKLSGAFSTFLGALADMTDTSTSTQPAQPQASTAGRMGHQHMQSTAQPQTRPGTNVRATIRIFGNTPEQVLQAYQEFCREEGMNWQSATALGQYLLSDQADAAILDWESVQYSGQYRSNVL